MSIDWSKPIEAYHVDGRVAQIEPTTMATSYSFNDYYAGRVHGDGWSVSLFFDKRGEPTKPSGWRIRNVADAPDFTPCERTIRMCIEALPRHLQDHEMGHWDHAVEAATAVLQSLLPDPAKALVEEFAGSGTATKVHVTDDGIRPFVDPLEFARWLIGTGRIRSGE